MHKIEHLPSSSSFFSWGFLGCWSWCRSTENEIMFIACVSAWRKKKKAPNLLSPLCVLLLPTRKSSDALSRKTSLPLAVVRKNIFIHWLSAASQNQNQHSSEFPIQGWTWTGQERTLEKTLDLALISLKIHPTSCQREKKLCSNFWDTSREGKRFLYSFFFYLSKLDWLLL